ncbi:hypothetical protein V2G26_020890 [Clonostachys chloroleuca]
MQYGGASQLPHGATEEFLVVPSDTYLPVSGTSSAFGADSQTCNVHTPMWHLIILFRSPHFGSGYGSIVHCMGCFPGRTVSTEIKLSQIPSHNPFVQRIELLSTKNLAPAAAVPHVTDRDWGCRGKASIMWAEVQHPLLLEDAGSR